MDPHLQKKMSISVRFGIGATIRIGREIQCLPYAGFLKQLQFVCFHHLQLKIVFGR